jgi:hypothetical protein
MYQRNVLPASLSTLKMEAAGSSTMLVPAYQTVQNHITEFHNLNRIYVLIHDVFNDNIHCSDYIMLNRTSGKFIGKDVKAGNQYLLCGAQQNQLA